VGGVFGFSVLLLVGAQLLSRSRDTTGPNQVRVSALPGTDPGEGDTGSGGQGLVVDGIRCEGGEQLAFHAHAHLYILSDGVAQPVSALVGIPGGQFLPRCIYWMHTHDRTGVIHIEAPSRQKFNLGQFFDIWGQPLSASRVARLTVPTGQPPTVYVNGQLYVGDPRLVELKAHTQVVIELGRLVEPPGFDFGKL
jgi:hypothetical protein